MVFFSLPEFILIPSFACLVKEKRMLAFSVALETATLTLEFVAVWNKPA